MLHRALMKAIVVTGLASMCLCIQHMHRISLRMHTASRMHSIGLIIIIIIIIDVIVIIYIAANVLCNSYKLNRNVLSLFLNNEHCQLAGLCPKIK